MFRMRLAKESPAPLRNPEFRRARHGHVDTAFPPPTRRAFRRPLGNPPPQLIPAPAKIDSEPSGAPLRIDPLVTSR